MSAFPPMPTAQIRRRRLPYLVAAALAVGIAIGLLLSRGEDRMLAPGRGPDGDPLAYRPRDEATFEKRAAAGLSHVLYAKSPGGAIATARRVARFRPRVEAAAARYKADPDTIEAIVFLESAGRPEARAGNDLRGAVGLTQILAGTATGLLRMHVDLPRSRRLTRQIARADARAKRSRAARLRARRRQVDERFDPVKSLAATGRYLEFARGKLGGRADLATESYHMGVGNLQGALRAYGGDGGDGEVSYAQLYFDSTPLRHADAYETLAALGDDSATYLWRVLAAREIMRLYRDDRSELARLQALHARKATAEEVLHPLASTRVYRTPREIAKARATGELRALPANASDLYMRIDPRMGELAPQLHRRRALYRALKPESLAMLVYIAAGAHEISGQAPLIVTSTVRDKAYQRRLVRGNIQATRAYSLHTTGYAFDILRSYRSRRQALAFQFMLDRLTALDLIAWAVEPRAIHVTVSSDARALVPLLKQVK
jgi:transglycosylase-like protein with SLT domain